MLYTVIDECFLLQDWSNRRTQSCYYALPHGVVAVKNGRIDRICSTNLSDYLNTAFFPGQSYPKTSHYSMSH